MVKDPDDRPELYPGEVQCAVSFGGRHGRHNGMRRYNTGLCNKTVPKLEATRVMLKELKGKSELED